MKKKNKMFHKIIRFLNRMLKIFNKFLYHKKFLEMDQCCCNKLTAIIARVKNIIHERKMQNITGNYVTNKMFHEIIRFVNKC